jgi:HEAT repeat protein
VTAALFDADGGRLWLGAAIGVLILCALLFAVTASVLRYRNRRKEVHWTAREAKWTAPLMAVLTGEAPPTALWSRIEPGEELYFLDFLLRYARRLRGQSRETLSELAQPYLARVAGRMQRGDADRRARAVETVAQLGFDAHLDGIAASLAAPSPMDSMVAARGFARRRRADHVPLLLAHLSRLQSWSPGQLAALLASMGADAVAPLRAALADAGQPPTLRAIAADALRELRDSEAATVAAHVLEGARDHALIIAALRLIGALSRQEHAAAVHPFCDADEVEVRAAAMDALAATGTAADRALLRRGLDDHSGWVAIHAARGLVEAGDAESLRALIDSDHPRSALARQVLVERP